MFLQSKFKAKVTEFMFGPNGDVFPPAVSERSGIIGDFRTKYLWIRYANEPFTDFLASTVVVLSPLNEADFKSLACTDSFIWKCVEHIMNDCRNKLGSNCILEYKVTWFLKYEQD